MGYTIDNSFGWTLLSAVGISFHAFTLGFKVGAVRYPAFEALARSTTPAYAALLEAHKKATGETTLPKGGYPDTGSGVYTALLPYDQWYRFNCAQRAHLNTLEQLPTVLTLLLVSGISYPRFAAAWGLVYVVARELYAQGYIARGPGSRMTGGLVGALTMLTLLVSAVYGLLTNLLQEEVAGIIDAVQKVRRGA